ncbi:acyloxyacyl hydrolase [Pararhodospirillum oryzae]|uniref:Acyloxyacyl hydrolase n=1 Tax=Pararhodospirillum oryzae TaxID=478448 RepID=A0A512HC52_9PROT|nr:acyloxyacyl hydrolase [Pararhodospirillum oryzae]GEO83027.1 acyloxyacyl hydrolase [Pararhodospirillum oryzae]
MRARVLTAVALGVALVMAPGTERTARADPAFNVIWISSAALLAAGAVGDMVRGNAIGSDTMPREVDLLTFGAGLNNVWHDNEPDGDLMPALFRFEYRPSYYAWIAHPLAGIEVTSRGSTYLYGGLMADVRFGQHLIVSPSAALGWYQQGDGRDLGLPLEFRTGLEAAWRFDDGLRIGAAFHHLSNAELGDSNPGVEEATLNVSLPIQYFVGR